MIRAILLFPVFVLIVVAVFITCGPRGVRRLGSDDFYTYDDPNPYDKQGA